MRPVHTGEVWQEVDTRLTRYVKVMSVHNGAVILRRCDAEGGDENGRRTTAKQERFNGKRGGYRYCFSTASRRREVMNAITVWKDGTWKVWQATDAHYAENDPEWLVTIPLPVDTVGSP